MISLLVLSFVTFTKAQALIDTIHIYAGYTKDQIKNFREEKQEEYEEAMNECRKDEYMKDICEIIYAALKPLNMISEDEVEETIKNIDAFSLIIYSYGYSGKIDLSKLKRRAEAVSILQTDQKPNLDSSKIINNIKILAKEMQIIKPDFTLNNVLQIHKSLMSHNKAEKAYGSKSVLEIVGDVKNKVGYFQISSVVYSGGTIRIIDSPVNSNCAVFLLCTFESDSKPINSNYLTVDLTTYNSLHDDQYKSKQFCLSLFGTTYDNYKYKKIHYTTSGWELYYGKYKDSLTKISFELPFDLAETFGILTNSLHFLITRVIEEFELKGLNISVGLVPSTGASDLQEKDVIYVELDENWENSQKKPEINIVADSSKYELDKEVIDKKIAKLEEPYKAEPKKPKNKTGIIIGVVVAVVVVIVVIVVVVIVVKKKKAAKAGSSNQEGGEDNTNNNAEENQA